MSVGKKILWVDDEPAQILDKAQYLEDCGYDVAIVPSTKECMKIMQEKRFDLVILDVLIVHTEELDVRDTKLGLETGIALARWIRSNFPETLIVGCSVKTDERIVSWFREFCSEFWAKHEVSATPALPRMVEGILSHSPSPLKIFIIHGHEDKLLLELKDYVQNVLKIGDPIILREQPSLGRTIIEKFEEETRDVDLVFALLTPDDKVYEKPRSDSAKRRARQNVVFEMGYFYGKLRRNSGRIILLYKGESELPSDILGVICINIDDGIKAAGEEIRRELMGFLR